MGSTTLTSPLSYPIQRAPLFDPGVSRPVLTDYYSLALTRSAVKSLCCPVPAKTAKTTSSLRFSALFCTVPAHRSWGQDVPRNTQETSAPKQPSAFAMARKSAVLGAWNWKSERN